MPCLQERSSYSPDKNQVIGLESLKTCTSGNIQHRLFYPRRCLSNIAVNKSADIILSMYRDLPGGNYSVDIISANGEVVGHRTVEFQSKVLVNTLVVP